MNYTLLVLLFFLLNYQSVHLANILGFFVYPSFSHQSVFQAIWKHLSLRGHNVTIVTPNPLNDTKLVNLTEIDVSSVYTILEEFNLQDNCTDDNGMWETFKRPFTIVDAVLETELKFVKLEQLENSKYDLILFECHYPTLYGLAHNFEAPIVAICSMEACSNTHIGMGTSMHPIVFPDVLVRSQSQFPTFLERIERVAAYVLIFTFNYFNRFPKSQQRADQYFKTKLPDIAKLETDISTMFVNTNPFLHLPRPLAPLVKEMNQLHIKPVSPLPKDLQKFLDDATEGAIYFSLGSIVKIHQASSHFQNVIFQAISELPFKVLLKWEGADLDSKGITNVIGKKWFPQQDILAHPNVKLFVSHCGLQSLEEAMIMRVPLVGIPFFVDQPMNCERIADHEIGLKLNLASLTADQLKSSIIEVIFNKKYKNNIERIGKIFEDKAMSNMKMVIWWLEYIIRHKTTKHFKSTSAGFSWFQFLLIDVILTFLVLIALSVYLGYKLIKVIFQRLLHV